MDSMASKNLNVCRILRSRLMRGTYRDRLPSIRQLAKELSTDPKTVQCALAQLEVAGLVRRVPRRGTFAVGGGEGTTPQAATYVCITTDSPSIVRGDTRFFGIPIIAAFHDEAKGHQLDVVIRFSDDPSRTVAKALDDARNHRCAGTCLLSIPVSTATALRLAQAGGGIVVADWDMEEILVPCVVFDNLVAGRQAAEHLMQLGHRRIAYVSGTRGSPSQEDRWQGFCQALARAGLTPPAPIVDMDHFSEDFLASVRGPDAPTAVVICNTSVADETIQLVESAGMVIPRDLSVITFGGYLTVTQGRRITAVVMDYQEMGKKALQALLDEDAFRRSRREVIRTTLVVGTTTAPPDSR